MTRNRKNAMNKMSMEEFVAAVIKGCEPFIGNHGKFDMNVTHHNNNGYGGMYLAAHIAGTRKCFISSLGHLDFKQSYDKGCNMKVRVGTFGRLRLLSSAAVAEAVRECEMIFEDALSIATQSH